MIWAVSSSTSMGFISDRRAVKISSTVPSWYRTSTNISWEQSSPGDISITSTSLPSGGLRVVHWTSFLKTLVPFALHISIPLDCLLQVLVLCRLDALYLEQLVYRQNDHPKRQAIFSSLPNLLLHSIIYLTSLQSICFLHTA
jgi:hypothetical protein